MPNITVIEFLPISAYAHSRTREKEIPVPLETFQQWEKMKALGLRVTAEVLRTGEVNVCIEEPELGDYDLFVVPNRADVVEKLTIQMINHFNESDFTHWKTMREE